MADENNSNNNNHDTDNTNAPSTDVTEGIMTETKDDMEVRHRKELKALDGVKRAALKKAKATAGKSKKGKDLLQSLEAEYDAKLQELHDRHALELAKLADAATTPLTEAESGTNGNNVDIAEATAEQQEDGDGNDNNNNIGADDAQQLREKKQLKARRKREKQREKDRQRQQEIERQTKEAGPSLRQVEMEQLDQQLAPLHLKIQQVQADGHCLYRAVGAQCRQTYSEIRNLCADALKQHEDEFGAFVEFTDSVTNYDQYVEQVRSSSEWGGHVELRALSMALRRPIYVYSAREREPLILQDTHHHLDDDDTAAPPIRLSYHLHYYALGEHYNHVVLADEELSA